MKCSESKLTVGIWKLLLADLHGTRFELPFYLVEGDGYLLDGNAIASKCQILKDESVIIIPEGTEGLSDKRLFLPTYLSDNNRTHLLVVSAQSKCFSSNFSSVRSLYASFFPNREHSKFTEGL